MARRKLSDVSHPDPLLTEDFWLQFGDDPQPPMRLKILYVTFGEVENSGPGSFNVASVCDRLGITYPMVNHYFGGRDGLLAEGAYMVYQRYIQGIWDAVTAAPRDPEARLKAWMKGQLSGTLAMGGWGPLLNYPLAAREVTEVIQAKFQAHMNRLFELNLARVHGWDGCQRGIRSRTSISQTVTTLATNTSTIPCCRDSSRRFPGPRDVGVVCGATHPSSQHS